MHEIPEKRSQNLYFQTLWESHNSQQLFLNSNLGVKWRDRICENIFVVMDESPDKPKLVYHARQSKEYHRLGLSAYALLGHWGAKAATKCAHSIGQRATSSAGTVLSFPFSSMFETTESLPTSASFLTSVRSSKTSTLSSMWLLSVLMLLVDI